MASIIRLQCLDGSYKIVRGKFYHSFDVKVDMIRPVELWGDTVGIGEDKKYWVHVKIQNSIPVARINTYAFWATRLFTFCGRSITPFVFTENMITTNTRTMTMVYFFNISEKLIFFSIFLLSFT